MLPVTNAHIITAELVWTGAGFERDVALSLDGDRIVSVGAAGADAESWGRVALVPGTVNAHGHAFQNLLKGFADDRRFESWRDDVLYPYSSRLDGDAIFTGAQFAFAEALLAGVTTTVDFFYLHDAGNENATRVIEAARSVGIRLVLARAFYDPDAPTRAPDRYREQASDAARRCLELAGEHSGDPSIYVQPAPHSLHAASPETVRVALGVARELDCTCHLHLAEASYEVEQIRARYGTTPVRLLADNDLLDERLLTVHSVWLDDEELDLLAEAQVGVVHCPGANAFLGDGIARMPEMLERGIRVALGPDGGCANNRQSIFEEMRLAGLFAKARLTDGAAIDSATVFDLGTRGGAGLLGVETGEFRPGALADVVALDLDDLSLQPLATLEKQIVNSMQPGAISRVMVGGEVVVEKGRLTKIDSDQLVRDIAVVTRGWKP